MALLTPRKRLHVKTLLWSDKPDRLCPNGENPWILPYIHQGSQIRPAVLVIPGGGYQHVCHGYEGSDVAEAYFELGYNTFVLNYSCGEKHPYPDPLQDAARAVKMIRANAEKYFVDPKKIIALGFSAGGHLAGTLGTSIISRVNAENDDDADGVSPRVDGLVLCYPVVEFNDRLGHKWSGVNLLGKPAEEITDQEIARFSLIENIDSKTPPTFLFHTATDLRRHTAAHRGAQRQEDSDKHDALPIRTPRNRPWDGIWASLAVAGVLRRILQGNTEVRPPVELQ